MDCRLNCGRMFGILLRRLKERQSRIAFMPAQTAHSRSSDVRLLHVSPQFSFVGGIMNGPRWRWWSLVPMTTCSCVKEQSPSTHSFIVIVRQGCAAHIEHEPNLRYTRFLFKQTKYVKNIFITMCHFLNSTLSTLTPKLPVMKKLCALLGHP